jgi:hypothetical protein
MQESNNMIESLISRIIAGFCNVSPMGSLPRLLAQWSRPIWVRGLAAILLLAGAWLACRSLRDAYDFYGGRFFDDTGRYGRAVPALERYLARHPDGPTACPARLRVGRIYARRFGRYVEARRHFEAAARSGQSACSTAARAEIMNCPDYFPLEPGRTWVYGDTASGGRNMRLEVMADLGPDGRVALRGALFAGAKRVSVTNRRYAKRDWAVWEEEKGRETAILRYPLTAGNSWKTLRAGRNFSYRVDADGLEVKTLAGRFTGCIKVRETDPRMPSAWKFDYYAPGIGRVKTTVAAAGVEHPNTELVKAVSP